MFRISSSLRLLYELQFGSSMLWPMGLCLMGKLILVASNLDALRFCRTWSFQSACCNATKETHSPARIKSWAIGFLLRRAATSPRSWMNCGKLKVCGATGSLFTEDVQHILAHFMGSSEKSATSKQEGVGVRSPSHVSSCMPDQD